MIAAGAALWCGLVGADPPPPVRDPAALAVALEELAPMPPKEERARDKMIGSFSAIIQRLAIQSDSKDQFVEKVLKQYADRPKEEVLKVGVPHLIMFWFPQREDVQGVHMYRAGRRPGFPATLGELTEETFQQYVTDLLSHFSEDVVRARRKPGALAAHGKITRAQVDVMRKAWRKAHPAPDGEDTEERERAFLKEIKEGGADRYLPTSTWLGTFTEEVAEGLKVVYVEAYSPASKAGLRKGDILTAWDGAALTKKKDLSVRVRAAQAGSAVRLSFIREGRKEELRAALEAF